MNNTKVSIIIPARYGSVRFPGKSLCKIRNKELILHVAELSANTLGSNNVYIATDNENIRKVVEDNGFSCIMTSPECLTGTDRVAEASIHIDSDIIVNIHGDEPLLSSNDILNAIQLKLNNPDYIINCMSSLSSEDDVYNKKIPKVITKLNGDLIYISRQCIPGFKNKTNDGFNFKKQVCIYVYNKKELEFFRSCQNKSPLESVEDIEILRFIEHGFNVKMLNVKSGSYSVDYPEDISIVEAELIRRQKNELCY